MSVTVKYKNNDILSIPSSGDYHLNTQGKYLEDDIRIIAEAAPPGSAVIIDTLDSAGGTIREIITDSEVYLQNSKTIVPSSSSQDVYPDSGYTAFEHIIVDAVPLGTAGTPVATKGSVSNHSISITPSVTNTSGYIEGGVKTGTAVQVSASDLVSGTLTISSGGTHNVTNYASASVASGSAGTPTATKGTVSNNSISITPSVSNSTGYITGGTKTGTGVTVSASELVSGTYNVTSGGTKDVTNYASASVPTLTLPTSTATSSTTGYTLKATIDRNTSDRYLNIGTGFNSTSGYYKISGVANGSATTPAKTITANPGISVNSSTGVITASVSGSSSITPTVSAGYVSSGTAGTVSVSGSSTLSLTTQAAATITPSTSTQTAVEAGRYTTGVVKVAAVTTGTAGTPTATKGSVSNHSINVTPSVTNTTGWITGSTKTGTAVNIKASDLVSGSQTITEDGTYDVTNLSQVVVNMAYKTGDVISLGSNIALAGVITSGTKIASFTIPVAKSLANISSASCTVCKGGVRTPSGNNLNNLSDSTNWVGQSGITVSATKRNEYFMELRLTSTSAFTNGVNNTPVVMYIGEVSITLS